MSLPRLCCWAMRFSPPPQFGLSLEAVEMVEKLAIVRHLEGSFHRKDAGVALMGLLVRDHGWRKATPQNTLWRLDTTGGPGDTAPR